MILAAALLIATALAAQDEGPAPPDASPIPFDGPAWREVEQAPEWVASPPVRDGWHRFSMFRCSNRSGTAIQRATDLAVADAQRHVAQWLTPHLGREFAVRAASHVEGNLRVVERAFHFEMLRDANGKVLQVPGNSFATAWGLWELPVVDLVADLPAAQRALARRVLAAPAAAWERVDEQPDWAASAPTREGWCQGVVTAVAEHANEVEDAASDEARGEVVAALTARLAPAIGRDAAAAAVEAALDELAIVRRAWRMTRVPEGRPPGRLETTAWILWGVPARALITAVPEPQREQARRALR
ncbi:MAG: hypothetical protein KDE27_24740 [Planctomycetes bacterium]|nr:hypothetical protein [Planctomycetota bacterium]